jgi:adenylate cyclase
MSTPPSGDDLRAVLTGEHPGLIKFRRRLRHIPSSPRCKLCTAPFVGIGGAVLRHVGFGRYLGNPAICNACIRNFSKPRMTGAEIPATLMFCDIRGSTALGERLSPTQFHDFLVRFYEIGSESILDHDGLASKLHRTACRTIRSQELE